MNSTLGQRCQVNTEGGIRNYNLAAILSKVRDTSKISILNVICWVLGIVNLFTVSWLIPRINCLNDCNMYVFLVFMYMYLIIRKTEKTNYYRYSLDYLLIIRLYQ